MSRNYSQDLISAMGVRIAAVEAQVALLSERAGLPYEPVSSGMPADVVALARSGKKIEAIVRYRDLTGATMDEARDVVAGL
jgi:ribosomal protein L7/L12